MNNSDKCFIEAYRRQGIGAGGLMPLSDAMGLPCASENDNAEEIPPSDAEAEMPEAHLHIETPIIELSATESNGGHGGNADAASEEPSALRALLQVDGFAWPRICRKLGKAASGQIQSLADRVAAEAEKGRNLIGFTSDCEASGCTTLLLCVAQRLAAEMSVVVIDANGGNPAIAHDLGLLPDVGWKDVAADRLPLAEALIDSLQDRLTVLPYAGHQDAAYAPVAGGGIEPLRQLALHYDLALVDLGVLSPVAGDSSVLSCLDAAVIVRSLRAGQSGAARQCEQILRESGVGVVGVVENRCGGSAGDVKGVRDAA